MFCCCTHPDSCVCRICCMKRGIPLRRAYRITRAINKALSSNAGKEPVNKPLPGKMLGGTDVAFDDPTFTNLFPKLHDYLTRTTYDDGSPRVTSTLLVFLDAGSLRMCLNDRDNNRSAFICRATFNDALVALDEQLRKDTLEWRRRGDYNRNQTSVPF